MDDYLPMPRMTNTCMSGGERTDLTLGGTIA